MTIPQKAITRRGALAAGAGAVAGGLGLSGTALAAAGRALARLTPVQQAGQRVIFSYPGLTPPASLLDQISAGQAGGVIFFGENITSLSQIAGVVRQLKAGARRQPGARAPAADDRPGGRHRAPASRCARAVREADRRVGRPARQAANAGAGAGQNLAGVGMNLNLAPVLDVYRQAGNFDDEFGRSYSMDPDVCAECGAAFVAVQQSLRRRRDREAFPRARRSDREPEHRPRAR